MNYILNDKKEKEIYDLRTNFLATKENKENGIYQVVIAMDDLHSTSIVVELKGLKAFKVLMQSNGKRQEIEQEKTVRTYLAVYAEKNENGFRELVTGLPITVYNYNSSHTEQCIYCYGVYKVPSEVNKRAIETLKFIKDYCCLEEYKDALIKASEENKKIGEYRSLEEKIMLLEQENCR